MNAHDLRTPSDLQAQARMSRLLAAREARFRTLPTPRSQFRADAKAPFRPMTRVNVPTEPQPVPAWLAWTAMSTFSLLMCAASIAAIKWLLPLIWGLK